MRRRQRAQPQKLNTGIRARAEGPDSPRTWMSLDISDSGLTLLICLFLVFGALTAYASLVSNESGFCNIDDPHYVTENPAVQAGLTAESVRWAFTSFHGWNWHPLTWLSLQLDHDLYGLAAWGYHLTNILLHAANAVLLFLWLRHVTAAMWRSALVAVLFLLHPLHVESVAWIAERKDVLSTFFWILTLWAYALYVRSPALRRYVLVAVSLSLGLMAKPMLVTLPCVLLLLDWWPFQRVRSAGPPPTTRHARPSNLVLEKLPLFALTLAASIVTVLAQRSAMPPFDALPFSARFANALVSYWRYIGKTLWPIDLCIYYPHPEAGWPWWAGTLAGVGLVAVTALVLSRGGRRRPYLAVGWLWFLGTLVPVIGLVQVGMQAMADRYTYVPLIGLFILVVWGVHDLWVWRRWPAIVLPLGAGALALALFLQTRTQVEFWRDPLVFWSHVIEVEPTYYPAYLHTGHMLLLHRDVEGAVKYLRVAAEKLPERPEARYKLGLALSQLQRWPEAIAQLTIAAQLSPADGSIQSLLGQCYFAQLHLEKAVQHFEAARQLEPDSAQTLSQLGAALVCQGKGEEAKRWLTEALRRDPALEYARTQLGLLCLLEANHPEGQAHLRQALTVAPNDLAARFYLGWSLHATGQVEAAGQAYEQVERLSPDWPRTAGQLAWLLATQPEPGNRNGALALLYAEGACQMVPTPRPELFDALAAAQAEVGHYSDAATTMRQVLSQTPANASEREGREKRAKLFAAGHAFHGE